jgi:hypothetical protein
MIQRRIRIGEVAVGQPLPWNVYNDSGVLLLAEGARIQTADQLDRLLEVGLYIESTLTWHQSPQTALQQVLHACYRLAMLYRVPEQIGDFPAEVLAIARMLDEAQSRSPDVVVATVVLRRGGRYAVRHAVNSACVAASVLQAMGPTGQGNLSVLAAALTMNIGVLDLQDALSRQTEPMTPSQHARIERHPFDSEERLPDAAQLLALADLFCKRVADDSLRLPDVSRSVLRDILIEHGAHFDVRLGSLFIRALGVYPVGTVVVLSSGEIGVVCDLSDEVDSPWVCSLLAPPGAPLPVPTLRDSRDPKHAVCESLGATELFDSLDLSAIWGEEATDYPIPSEVSVHGVDQSV